MVFGVSTKTNSEFKKELLTPASYVGTLYSIIDLGTHTVEFKGEPKKIHKVRLSWEIPGEMRVFNEEKGEQPMAIHNEYTLSFNEKANLRKDLKAWRGHDLTEEEEKNETFDLETMIGKNCLLSISIKEGKKGQYNIIDSIGSMVKGSKPIALINSPMVWKLDDGLNEIFGKLPKWLKDTIEKCDEWNPGEDKKPTEEDDDLPF